MTSKRFLAVALVACAFVAGALVGARTDLFGERQDLVAEALEVIDESYFKQVDPEQLEAASVRAIVRQLRERYDDRFSHYFDPEAYAEFRQATQGEFTGVGMTVTQVPRGLRVATVFEDSPADQAGIREQDVVTAVNGRSIAGQGADLAAGRIKGEPGTEVTLTVLRPSTGRELELELTRARLDLPVVEGEIRRVDGVPIAHVRLLSFSSGAHSKLREEVEELYGRGAQGLVLDLRGNSGGLLTEAVLTSSVFVEDGVIVSTEGRTQEREAFDAVGDALEPRPAAVLINRDTASAAEILAAALADAGLAEVVGQRSFGKGTFQQVIPLENGGALDLTIGEYLARNGESLAGTGITPDVPVRDRPNRPGDEALRRALAMVAAELGE